MRKSIFSLGTVFTVMMVFTLTACEKVIVNEESVSGDVNGNLTVNVSRIEQIPFGSQARSAGGISTRAAVTDFCNRLNFAVYEIEGTRLKQVNQTAESSGFGTATFSLGDGEYQLVVLAHSSNGNPTMTNPAKIQFSNKLGFTDTFLYYKTVTVGEEHQTLDVSLDRIVSMCRFVINDAIPTGVASLEFYYTGGSGTFNAATGLGNVNSKQTMKFDVTAGDSGTEYDLYTFLHQEEDDITLTVRAYDAAGSELEQYKQIFEVPMKRRMITRLSGDYFTGVPSTSGDVSLTITINGDWDGQQNITY